MHHLRISCCQPIIKALYVTLMAAPLTKHTSYTTRATNPSSNLSCHRSLTSSTDMYPQLASQDYFDQLMATNHSFWSHDFIFLLEWYIRVCWHWDIFPLTYALTKRNDVKARNGSEKTLTSLHLYFHRFLSTSKKISQHLTSSYNKKGFDHEIIFYHSIPIVYRHISFQS